MNSTSLKNSPILIFDDARNNDTVERKRLKMLDVLEKIPEARL